MSESSMDISNTISQIRTFIDIKKEPDVIEGTIIYKSNTKNVIKVDLSKKLYFNKSYPVMVNESPGLVLESDYEIITVEIDSFDSFFENQKVEVDISPFSIIFNWLEKTIDKIENDDLTSRNKQILNLLNGLGNPTYSNSEINFFSKSLNNGQQISVNKAVNANDFHLIIGPPGTGKTFVIQELIYQMFRLDKQVLITAWTNIAVDNILGKINDIPESNILRIGSKKEINPENMKFTLFERRKEHPDWEEIEDIKKEISNQQKELGKLYNSLSPINEDISKLYDQKRRYSLINKNVKGNINEFKSLINNFKVNEVKKDPKLINIEEKINIHDLKAAEYMCLVEMVLSLDKLEKSLPNNDEFYLLESDLKKLKAKGLVKKITSIFNKSGFEEYKANLNQKEFNYEDMVTKFNSYWDFKDKVNEKQVNIYPQKPGQPDEDALENSLVSLEMLEELIPLKKKYMDLEYKNEANNILFESYKIYIESLEKKYELLLGEYKTLNEKISLKTNEKNSVLNIIDNTENTISNLKTIERNNTKKIDNDIFKKSRLIFSTVISSANPLMSEYSFDVMIMDEASQVASYMALIPLLKCSKFILVGDDKQLQPIEESELNEMHNKSIFNNLKEKYPDSCNFLNTQYRMNGHISNLASELFYGNKLKTHPPISNQLIDCNLKENIEHIINPLSPITFLDTSKIDIYEDGMGKGCKNTKEAIIVNNIVSYLIESGIDQKEIGVLSPYAKQKDKIRDILEYDVEVDTVYRFQGREKDIIIISFCKSKLGRLNDYVKKFIGKPSQINVAITRAKKKLILVGNLKNLKGVGILNDMVESMDEDFILQCTDSHLKDLEVEFESLE
jgi:superfamily I DNA and/or RNA helicase